MKDLTLPLPDKAYAGLQAVVDAHNALTSADLDIVRWTVRHLRELAFGSQLAVVSESLTKQHELQAQQELQASVADSRRALYDAQED